MTPQQQLVDLLAAEGRLHQRMIAVAEAKRAALLANDPPALAPLVRELEGLTATVARLEAERRRLALTLTGVEQPSFATLTATCDEATADRLAALRADLTVAIDRLRALNTGNQSLVQQALRFADGWKRLLNAAVPATYASSGAMVMPVVALSGRAWRA